MNDTSGSTLATFRSGGATLPVLPFRQRIARRALALRLQRLAQGEISLVERGSRRSFGHPTAAFPLSVRIDVADPRFYTSVALRGALGAAESYMDGDWSCDDLVGLIRVIHSLSYTD